jgi:hypothetical protein
MSDATRGVSFLRSSPRSRTIAFVYTCREEVRRLGIGQQAYGALRDRVPTNLRASVAGGVEAVGISTSSLRTLPTFLIVGGQRCGTNSLYEYLAAHPAIGRALPGQEVHYFDTNFTEGLSWYRGHFPTRLWLRAAEARAGCPAITGESSPYYMFHPLAPQRIATTLPRVRVLVLLRDPVDRAYSQFHHERANGNETLGFEEALDRESERLDGEVERIVADHRYNSFSHQHHSYVARGQYADQLGVLRSLFPAERMSIVLSERLFQEPKQVEEEVLAFLGPPARTSGTYARHNAGRYTEMPAALRHRLAARFADSNHRVAGILGFDPHWS